MSIALEQREHGISYGRLCVVCIVAALAVGGCKAAQRRAAWLARTDLVGISRDRVVACAGRPDSTERDGAREYLHYIAEPAGDEAPKDLTTCVATFVLRYDVVDRVDYSTPSGRIAAEPERCLERLRPCLTSVR